ncbi:hypothetical protein [Nocardia sp. NPDC051832]|uniref:hypothetical protein n=1 Tax=Nocardia sp. NPDC051832 TaxID=3155673 RepID=UPI00342E4B44
MTFTAMWIPPHCDVRTEVRIAWHTYTTGTYRLLSGLAGGYDTGTHDISVKKARQLLTGEVCFPRRYANAGASPAGGLRERIQS